MDPGFCENLTGLLDGLLIVLEDRPYCDDASVIHQFTDASHDAVALEEIVRPGGAPRRSASRSGSTPTSSRWPACPGPGEPGAADERARA